VIAEQVAEEAMDAPAVLRIERGEPSSITFAIAIAIARSFRRKVAPPKMKIVRLLLQPIRLGSDEARSRKNGHVLPLAARRTKLRAKCVFVFEEHVAGSLVNSRARAPIPASALRTTAAA